jgi:TolB-like protein/DNA-binding winged helix-turn-helix (wHTH) protein
VNDTEPSRVGDFRLGEWLVQPSLNRISRGDEEITLELKWMDVLVCLAERPGEMVSRQVIIDTVWATEFITDNTLTHTIAELRSVLGDDASDPTYIETIRRRGYRLIASVEQVNGQGGVGDVRAPIETKRWPHILAVGMAAIIALLVILPPEALFERRGEGPIDAPLPRIVVLPFENLGSPDDEYFADGITEEIISRMAAISGLQVISRTSAMYYKNRQTPIHQIRDDLGVDYVVEGTIRWDRGSSGHGRVRITFQLVRAADASNLWSEQYDRTLEDIFSVQSDISKEVISHLRLTLPVSEHDEIEARPTANMEAYQAYLKGLEYLNQPGYVNRDLDLAVFLLQRAVNLDPGFTLGYARLAEAHLFIHWRVFPSSERLEMAETAIETAHSLDPNLPQVHMAKGLFFYLGQRDYGRAQREFEAAKQNLGSAPDAIFNIGAIQRRQSRWEEGLTNVRKALRLDPQSGFFNLEVGLTLVFMRRYEDAKPFIEKSIELVPDQEFAYRALAYVHWGENGDLEKSRAVLESMPRRENPSSIQDWVIQHVLERDYPSALRVLAKAPEELAWREPRDLWEGLVYELMGDYDRAQDAFEKARLKLTQRIESGVADPWWSHCHLALALARLGQTEAALKEGRRADEMLPLSKDAVFGSLLAVRIAEAEVAAGDHEGALERIEHLLTIPAGLRMSRSLLELDPRWDPLRDHPRFQVLLEKYDTVSD